MIRIFQKEDREKENANNVITDLVNKNIKSYRNHDKGYSNNGSFNWTYDSWIYFFFRKIN